MTKPKSTESLAREISQTLNRLGFDGAITVGRWAPEWKTILDALHTIEARDKNPKVWAVHQRTHDEEQGLDVVHMHMLFSTQALANDYAAMISNPDVFVESIDVITEVPLCAPSSSSHS